MKKFFFRLETLLKIRKLRESGLQKDLDHSRQKWSQVKEKEKTLQMQIEALMQEISKKRAEGKLHLGETYAQILEHLNDSLKHLQHNLSIGEKQLEEQKALLRQAVQERKVIEKIKEKHYAGWQAKQGTMLDESTLRKPAVK